MKLPANVPLSTTFLCLRGTNNFSLPPTWESEFFLSSERLPASSSKWFHRFIPSAFGVSIVSGVVRGLVSIALIGRFGVIPEFKPTSEISLMAASSWIISWPESGDVFIEIVAKLLCDQTSWVTRIISTLTSATKSLTIPEIYYRWACLNCRWCESAC